MNYKTHARIPNHYLMRIARDPGYTYAINIGTGALRTLPTKTTGFDIVYEPILSETRTVAGYDIHLPGDRTIRKDERTIENHFRFHNLHILGGMEEHSTFLHFQIGYQVDLYSYRLHQDNHRNGTDRTQKELWVEITPTWGVTLPLQPITNRYSGAVIPGTGQPAVSERMSRADWLTSSADPPRGNDVIIAPAGDLQLRPVTVISHR